MNLAGSDQFPIPMEERNMFVELVRKLRVNRVSMKDMKEKGLELDNFCQIIESKNHIRSEFEKSIYVKDITDAVFDLAKTASEKARIPESVQGAVARFFRMMAKFDIPVAVQQEDFDLFRRSVLDLAMVVIPKCDETRWLYWIIILTDLITVPCFFTAFEDLAKREWLWRLVSEIMRYDWMKNPEMRVHMNAALKFLSSFIDVSPYPVIPSLIDKFFDRSKELLELDLDGNEFIEILTILTKLIPLSPISFIISGSESSVPFQDQIFITLLKKWNDYQRAPDYRKIASAFLLLFLTIRDAMKFDISQDLIDQWASVILNVWANVKHRSSVLDGMHDLPFLKADVEMLRRSSNLAISELLFEFINQKIGLNLSTNVMLLFTAIGRYAPDVVSMAHWRKILEKISNDDQTSGNILRTDVFGILCYLLTTMVDIVEDVPYWNKIFTNFMGYMKNPPSDGAQLYFMFINKLLSMQRIETKVAHKYQQFLWQSEVTPEFFTLDRLHCIHTFIYYYGFANDRLRGDCLTTLMTLYQSIDDQPMIYVKQLALTVASVLLPYSCELLPDRLFEPHGNTGTGPTIVDVCEKLSRTMRIIINENKSENPIQMRKLFYVSPESSQIVADDTQLFEPPSMEVLSVPIEEPAPMENTKLSSALCNFIDPKTQQTYKRIVDEYHSKNIGTEILFRLYVAVAAPSLFPLGRFMTYAQNMFLQECDVNTFGQFVLVFTEITELISGERFPAFFEDIAEVFSQITEKFLQVCDEEIRHVLNLPEQIAWPSISNVLLQKHVVLLPQLSKFAANCAKLAPEFAQPLYEQLEKILSTTHHAPFIHLDFCKNLLDMPIYDYQIVQVVNSLECTAHMVLSVLLVPVKEREKFLCSLFDCLKYVSSQEMIDLFRELAKYPMSPMVKEKLLALMMVHYENAPDVFNQLWENTEKEEDIDTFYMLEVYPSVRFAAIDTVSTILSLKRLNGLEFNKHEFFVENISPSMEGILGEADSFLQDTYTALGTLIKLAAEVPELTVSCLKIIFKTFTEFSLSMYPVHCLSILFSGLSDRVHFSIFLREFVPIMAGTISELVNKQFPFQLFFMDSGMISADEAMKRFCELAAPTLVSYAFAKGDQGDSLIDFISNSTGKEFKRLLADHAQSVSMYLLAQKYSCNNDALRQDYANGYEKVFSMVENGSFDSPLPLLALRSISDITDESIIMSYEFILRTNLSESFIDIRDVMHVLYRKTYSANHPLVMSSYLQQFSLYARIVFQYHKTQLEESPTLFCDLLALTIHLADFAPASEIEKLLLFISGNIPKSLSVEAVGLVPALEELAMKIGYHEVISNFMSQWPNLPDLMMILSPMRSFQHGRTLLDELHRIHVTKRVSAESIEFLLTKWMSNENWDDIDALKTSTKRHIMMIIHEFAMENPQTLALLLYSQMYLRFFDAHPSPHIIACDVNEEEQVFQQLIQLSRDKNPSISRAALTALSEVIASSKIPDCLSGNRPLLDELCQYGIWHRPTKNSRKPDTDGPWISRFTCSLISKLQPDTLSFSFGNLCAKSPEFAAHVFPIVFYECLDSPMLAKYLIKTFTTFGENPLNHVEECRHFLKALVYLRFKWFNPREVRRSSMWFLKWHSISINFENAARVSLAVGDPYQAYQFAEFAKEANQGSFVGDTTLLREIFTKIGGKELLHGLNIDLSSPKAIAMLHEQENRLNRSLVLLDNAGDSDAMCDALRMLHLYHFLDNMKTERNIDSLWRLQKWTVPSRQMREMKMNVRSAGLFQVMQAFATRNQAAVAQKLENFLKLFKFDLESTVSDQLSQLLNANLVQWFQALLFTEPQSKLRSVFPHDLVSMFGSNMKFVNQLSERNFPITEMAHALNGVFLCIIKDLDKIQVNARRKFFSETIATARRSGEIEAAQYFISLMRKCEPVSQYCDFEQLQLLYADNPHHALALIHENAASLALKDHDADRRVGVFNLRVKLAEATWSAETHGKVSSSIMESLESVIEEANSLGACNIEADAHFTLAKFFKGEHRQVCNDFLSQDFRTINEIIANSEEILRCAKAQAVGNTHTKEMRQVKHDLDHYKENVAQQRERFSVTITNAIEHYLCAMTLTNRYDTEALYSLVGLWFGYSFSKYKEFVQDVPNLLESMEYKLPSVDKRKFLPLFYQLAARVDDPNSNVATQSAGYKYSFQELLKNLVFEITTVEPAQCLPILYALYRNEPTTQSHDAHTVTVISMEKIEAIQELIIRIASSSPDLEQQWAQMSQLLDNYVALAGRPRQKNIKQTRLSKVLTDKPFDRFISSNMPKTHIITTNKVVGIAAFTDKVQIQTGVSRPVLMRVTGTDGKIYKQIVKGDKDDLRQDSVMQQLFVLSSKLLSASDPSLSIRNYKVVPLTPKAGVIEFVERTTSIQDWHHTFLPPNYETSPESAFYRYAESDAERNAFINVMARFQGASENYWKGDRRTPDNKQAVFQTFDWALKVLKPVFRFFFLERFPNPGDWFTSRMRYARHCATNSMCGYLFGVGDRHLNNILIDKETGELVHIDLGVAFDQGRALPIPENIPFRLTPAIIDGMGWKAQEGVFTRACEKSLAVFRQNSEYFLTVLEVVMNDPLYTWTLVPRKKRVRTELVIDQTPVKAKTAESVIITCRRKLEGQEHGDRLSVEGQVATLIAEATDRKTLAMMYHGWKPFI